MRFLNDIWKLLLSVGLLVILRLIWLNCIDSHYINYLMPALELTVLKVVFGFSECLPDFSSIHAAAVDFEYVLVMKWSIVY